MGALLLPLGEKPGPGRSVPAESGSMQRKQSPLQPPRDLPKGSVWKRLSIWLMFTCVSYWRASLFSPSPGLFTQTSCSLTTRIAFSAILLTSTNVCSQLGGLSRTVAGFRSPANTASEEEIRPLPRSVRWGAGHLARACCLVPPKVSRP